MKTITCLIALLFSFFFMSELHAQQNIEARVLDKTNKQALELVTVRLLNPSDSTLIQGAQTDKLGFFHLKGIKAGNYLLLLSSVGYKEKSQKITLKNNEVFKLNDISLEEDAQLLSEFEVKGTAVQLVVRGDTLEYNAGAFKMQENAVVEELLKRLPGLQISPEGKITVNGEEIKKIRLDGKKFFDGDIEMATKNLPADMIDKIQVLDQKSEMSQLSGFEDDDTERIINLTIKEDKKKGYFGNINGGSGMDSENNLRYKLNSVNNLFNPKSQTSIIVGSNNINESQSSYSRRGRGRGNDGINSSQQIGINNNSIINEKLKLGLDASFGHSTNRSIAEKKRLNYLKNEIYTDSTHTRSHNGQYATNINLEIEWTPDSLNKFIFQPQIDYYQNQNDKEQHFLYQRANDAVNDGNSINYGDANSGNGGLRIIYNRKFAKKGRSFTTMLRSHGSFNKNESFNYSYQNISPTKKDSIDQKTNNVTKQSSYGVRLSYVEPLWNNKNLIELSMSLNSSQSSINKTQHDNTRFTKYAAANLDQYQNDEEREYTKFNSEYSNQFKNIFYRENAELNYQLVEKKYNFRLGFKIEPSQIIGYNYIEDKTTNSRSLNFSPTGRLQYRFDKKETLNIDYRGWTRSPSINQLQPIKDNSNPMNETVGNANLKPSYSQHIRFSYNKFNQEQLSSLNFGFFFSFEKDALVSNIIYDTNGKLYSQTVNAGSTPYFLRSNFMYNRPILKKRIQFNSSSNFNFDQIYAYSSRNQEIETTSEHTLPRGELSSTQSLRLGENLALTYSNKTIEFGLRALVNYRRTKNNLNKTPVNIWEWEERVNFVLFLPLGFSLNSDLAYTNRKGYSSFDRNELIWNAAVEKKILKNKGMLSLSVNDILQQKSNIYQSIGDNYIEYNKLNTLTSYFLLNFSYQINQIGGGKIDAGDKFNRDKRRGRPRGPGEMRF